MKYTMQLRQRTKYILYRSNNSELNNLNCHAYSFVYPCFSILTSHISTKHYYKTTQNIYMLRIWNWGIVTLLPRIVTTYRFVYELHAVMYSTMHFRAFRNRGSPYYHFANKALGLRRYLCLSNNFISPSFATSNDSTIQFQIIQNQCHFEKIRKMSTARLAGKKIDDVLYPTI